MTSWRSYAKALVAVLGALLIATNSALNGGDITAKQIEDVVIAVAAAIAVFAVPNAPR